MMKTNTRQWTPRPLRAVRLALPTRKPEVERSESNARLTELKDRLTRQRLAGEDPVLKPAMLRAANDAASMAWATGVPLLVFPALFEEQAARARVRAAWQACIRQRSAALLGLAA